MEHCDSRRIKEIRDNTAKMADAFTRIADALERLADRKTENNSEIPNNCDDEDIFEYCPRCGMRMLSKWYEPQMERSE